jgi:hypothetical protein
LVMQRCLIAGRNTTRRVNLTRIDEMIAIGCFCAGGRKGGMKVKAPIGSPWR